MSATFQDENYLICNVYAPNKENHQIQFFDTLEQKIVSKNVENIIIGGDFNTVLNRSIDHITASKTKERTYNGRDRLLKTMATLKLIDIWGKKSPEQRTFTYRNRNNKPTVQSRLDVWLISENLADVVSECRIIPSIAPDHSAVTLVINSTASNSRGPGLWKFNSELLKEGSFVQEMKTEIKKSEKIFSYVSDARTKWELIKCDIRSFAQVYSRKRAKIKRDREKELERELETLEKQIGNNPDDETLAKYERTKNTLTDIANSKEKSAMLRSKVRWHEEGERSTKYFANLEKKNFEKKHISNLERQDGNLTSDPKEILKEGATYYRNLYTANKSINPDNKKFEKFFKIGQEMKLSDTDEDSLEGQLTLSECKKALQQ